MAVDVMAVNEFPKNGHDFFGQTLPGEALVFKGFGSFETKILVRLYGSDRNFSTCTNEESLYSARRQRF